MSGAVGVRHWSHVIIHPVDVDASLEFYTKLLGYEVLSDEKISGPGLDAIVGREGVQGRVVVGLVGGQKVEFVYLGDPDLGGPQDNERGLRGFTVRVADINEAADACTAHGVPILSGPSEIKGFWQFMIMDPDGVAIEISQPPPGVELSGPLS